MAYKAHKQKGTFPALSEISIEGFKSIKNSISLDIKPITLLAGANSSGKSAAIQPLLLLKQTLHAHYDLGPLKIDGPNVFFRNSDEMFWREPGTKGNQFTVSLRFSDMDSLRMAGSLRRLIERLPLFDVFTVTLQKKNRGKGGGPSLKISQVEWRSSKRQAFKLDINKNENKVELSEELIKKISEDFLDFALFRHKRIRAHTTSKHREDSKNSGSKITIEAIERNEEGVRITALIPEIGKRTFLLTTGSTTDKFIAYATMALEVKENARSNVLISPFLTIEVPSRKNIDLLLTSVRNLIHLPGLRGNPKRLYPVRDVQREYAGLFSEYAASLIRKWQEQKTKKNLDVLKKHLQELRISWGVKARRESDAEIKLLLGRTVEGVRGGAADYVNIADTGLGASQVLPILVALVEAKPNQIVYIEQPELHLHPNAQVALANLITQKAANEGVRFIIETHSMYMLMAIQRAIAKGNISNEDVVLHWFSRDKRGVTDVSSTGFESDGSYSNVGTVPEDFSSIAMKLIEDIALSDSAH